MAPQELIQQTTLLGFIEREKGIRIMLGARRLNLIGWTDPKRTLFQM